jgi:DNA-binding GntR family transcriptional regulator
MEKIKLIPAREQIATEIKHAIISGQLQPGEELVQMKIAEMLGVSRMPIREAFHILEKDGYIILENSRKAIVSDFTIDNIIEHYELRALLEGNVAFRAAQTRPDVTQLQEIVDLIDKNLGKPDFVHYNEMFHKEIWHLSQSPKHTEIITNLWNRIPHQLVVVTAEGQRASNMEHKKILLALKEADAPAADHHMRQHILRSMSDYTSRLKKELDS